MATDAEQARGVCGETEEDVQFFYHCFLIHCKQNPAPERRWQHRVKKHIGRSKIWIDKS